MLGTSFMSGLKPPTSAACVLGVYFKGDTAVGMAMVETMFVVR